MTDINNPPTITPEKVREFLDEASNRWININEQPLIDLAREYLNLHEENQRLHKKLEIIVADGRIKIAKEIMLTEENQRLRGINEELQSTIGQLAEKYISKKNIIDNILEALKETK